MAARRVASVAAAAAARRRCLISQRFVMPQPSCHAAMSNVDRQMLKQCRALLQEGAWGAASDKAKAILEFTPDSYNALVFLGLAQLHLGNPAASAAAYMRATELDPVQVLAWQGLEKTYEMQQQWDKLMSLLEEHADVQLRVGAVDPCATALGRLVKLAREHGTQDDLRHVLMLFYPGSRFYALLSTLPAPDQTAPNAHGAAYDAQMLMHGESLAGANELIQMYEELHEREIESDFARQKNTLEGAKLGWQLKGAVVAEVLRRSPLPTLYEFVLAHPAASDEARRDVEDKLLRHYYRLTLSLPSHGVMADMALNAEVRDKTLDIAHGMVTIGVSNELAWRLDLEWRDFALPHLPYDTLREYVERFPHSGRALAFRALLCLVRDEAYLRDAREAGAQRAAEDADLLQLALDGLEATSNSILCQRIVALFYLLDRDYASALDVLRSVHTSVRERAQQLSMSFAHVQRELASQLAITYVHLHPPKHHNVAGELAERVLRENSHDIDARFARAYVAAQRGAWTEARADFAQVLAEAVPIAPAHGRSLGALALGADAALEAEAQLAHADQQLGHLDDARKRFEALIERSDNDENVFGSTFRARLWHWLGGCFWAMGGDYREAPAHAYRCFIEAIKRCATFAPAFTALGAYYEAARPPDTVRASKCFQKAFELDASEYEAARRLVEQYAAQREWSLVDVVARRVVEAEGGVDVLTGRASNVHVTPNAWVWKAIGIVESLDAHADAAICAFQVALRTMPRDADAWVRLGEAYVASGRPIAALKTYARALDMLGDVPAENVWHIYYNVADAQRQLGRFDVAIPLLEDVLRSVPAQQGVRAVTAEMRLSDARRLLTSGYMLRAIVQLHASIQDAALALEADKQLRTAWKVVADACFLLAKVELDEQAEIAASAETPLAVTLHGLVLLLGQQDLDARLPAVSVVKAAHLSDVRPSARTPYPHEFLEYAAVVYKYLALVQALDTSVSASAWCDLASALCRLSWIFPLPATVARCGMSLDAAQRRADLARAQGIECTHVALAAKPHARLWLLLGNLHFSHDRVLAQHAYIMAIEASARSPVPWTNLGFLYLSARAYALAEEAFVRAQTIAPDWPASWLGSAFVHVDNRADGRVCARLFEQAYMLSEGALLEADYGFADMFFARIKQGATVPETRFMAPLLALNQYIRRVPRDDAALHLSALLAEQLGASALAVHRIECAARVLETEYEATESTSSALRYGLASSNLGRIRLSQGDADGAIEAFDAALSLLEVPSDECADVTEIVAARIACAVVLAKAHFLSGDPGALAMMDDARAALASTQLPEDRVMRLQAWIAVLRAQMQWAAQTPVADIASGLDEACVYVLSY